MVRPFPALAIRGGAVLVLATACAVGVVVAGPSAGGPKTGVGSAVPAPPSDYGHDPVLDRLWDGCQAGRAGDCEELYWASPVGSGYERSSVGR